MTDFATTLTENFRIIAIIMQSIAVLIGVAMTLGGIYGLKKHAEQRTMMSSGQGAGGPIVLIVCGAIMLTLPQFLGVGLMAIFSNASPAAYTGDTSGVGA